MILMGVHSPIQVVEGKTMYRTTTDSGRHKWLNVDEGTSLKLHKMAANFLFTSIGVLSLHMGRDKHAKFLRHLGAYEVRHNHFPTLPFDLECVVLLSDHLSHGM